MSEQSTTARVLHNLGLAIWFGGSLFGQVALNPTVDSIGDKAERGRVLNEGWARFNAVNAVAIAATILTWRLGGLRAADRGLDRNGLVGLKDFLLGGAATNAIASAVSGAQTASQAPEDAPAGGTPVESGTQPAPETPGAAARAQRLISFFGPGSLVLLAGVVAVSSVLESSRNESRVDLRRLFS